MIRNNMWDQSVKDLIIQTPKITVCKGFNSSPFNNNWNYSSKILIEYEFIKIELKILKHSKYFYSALINSVKRGGRTGKIFLLRAIYLCWVQFL